jgi:segregation and condensation protein B
MSETDVLPEVGQIVGAMLFASRQPLTVKQIRQVFARAAGVYGGLTEQYAGIKDKDIETSLESLGQRLEEAGLGFRLVEAAGGWKLQNDKVCGPWLRELLEKGKPNRLSRPALETLSIIAYRQPLARSEIEAIRGVASDSIVRSLLDMQLIRVTGRSEMAGRPWLYGTTTAFLEYFGIKSLEELPGIGELRRLPEPAPSEPDPQPDLPSMDEEASVPEAPPVVDDVHHANVVGDEIATTEDASEPITDVPEEPTDHE